jgi:hypothetical protein
LKARLWLLFASLLFASSFIGLVSAQTGQIYLEEDFNYSSLDQMQAAGWTFTRPTGISVAAGAVTLDGTNGDCTISRATSFSNGVYDWKVEVRSKWLGQGHSVLSVFLGTESHTYGWAADGYYKEFSFYRDNQKVLHFGIYEEKANQFVVLSMVREGNTFSFYFNGELKNTYSEQDAQQSAVTGLSLVSPWKGDAKYDYYMLSEPTGVMPSSTSEETASFPTMPVLIGGGIATLFVGGVVVYYFFIAGSQAGASAGSASGGTSGTGGSGSSVIEEHPISPLNGETPPRPPPTKPPNQPDLPWPTAVDSNGNPYYVTPNGPVPVNTSVPNQPDLPWPTAVDSNGNPYYVTPNGPVPVNTSVPNQPQKPTNTSNQTTQNSTNTQTSGEGNSASQSE